MNKRMMDRIRALEERVRGLETGIVRLGFETDADGEITAFTLPDLGRRLEPDAFWALVDEWEDVVFFPAGEVPDPAKAAYDALEDEALLSLTPADLERENRVAEAVRRGEADPGFKGALEEATARAREADPERAALADRHEAEWEGGESFWGLMRERAERMGPQRP